MAWLVIGISATAFETEKIAGMKPGDTLALDSYTLRLERIGPITGPNYNAIAAEFSLRDASGTLLETLRPAKRVYIGRQMPTSEVGRFRHGLSEIYLAIGETSDGQHVDLRAYHKPFVLLIWLGPLLMAIGGVLSLLDRRLRIGVPARRARLRPEPAE